MRHIQIELESLDREINNFMALIDSRRNSSLYNQNELVNMYSVLEILSLKGKDLIELDELILSVPLIKAEMRTLIGELREVICSNEYWGFEHHVNNLLMVLELI